MLPIRQWRPHLEVTILENADVHTPAAINEHGHASFLLHTQAQHKRVHVKSP